MQLVGIHIYNLDIAWIKNQRNESLFIILQVHSTCFGFQTHPSSGVHKTVTTTSGTALIFYAAAQKDDQYRRLWLQFCVLLMMGVVDTQNMQSEPAE